MEPVLSKLAEELAKLQLHPVADHFTVALLFVGVAIDLISNLAPSRAWIRYMALTLMILGALAAGASYATGDMETDRIWDALGPPARQVLKWHATLGVYLAITFGVLALWRILIESFGFMAGSRGFYQLVAILAILTLSYSAHLGGKLVYEYGAGTALMAAQPAPSEASSPAAEPSSSGPMATVSVPTPIPAPAPPAEAAPAEPKPSSSPTASSPAAPAGPVPAHPAPSASPAAMPGPSAKPTGSAAL